MALFAFLSTAFADDQTPSVATGAPAFRPREYVRPVTTWIPPYGIAKARRRLEEKYGEGTAAIGPADVITHLALQFWLPDAAGTGLERVSQYGEISDSEIREIRDQAHARGERVLLCLYNFRDEKWNWELARNAFATHRDAFIEALLAEVNRLGLDGIDIDLEGNGKFDTDQDAFVQFLAALSARLPAAAVKTGISFAFSKEKHLTVDSFCNQWNAPNTTWWARLFPLVTYVNCMGYEHTGIHGKPKEEWRAYDFQLAAAGPANVGKLQIGVPSSKDAWQGGAALTQLQWLARNAPACGLAIWDAQFPAAAWRRAEVWELLNYEYRSDR